MNDTGLTKSNIFHLVKLQYGESMLADVRRLERTSLKYGNYTNHLRFSLRCLHTNLLPKDLQLKCKVNTTRSREILHKAGKLLLQERIHMNHMKRDRLKREVECLRSNLKEKLKPDEFDAISIIHAHTLEKNMTTAKERHLKKFENLVNKQNARKEQDNQSELDKSRWIMNLSTKELTNDQTKLLSKGMNFSITPKEIPVKEIVSRVENTVKNLEKAESDNIRAKVSLTLQKAKAPIQNLSKAERLSLKQLREDESIVILPADKGRASVILNKEDYVAKCNQHIDNGPYKYLKKDPTECIKREARTKLQKLKEREIIDQSLYFKLKPTDSPAPRFYGLPKIHKPDIPIRPIVSYVGTPLYKLSKYIASILQHYTKSGNNHSKNSKEFSEYIRQQTVDEDEIMVSFDVTSLYTNVPIKDTLLILKDLLNNDQDLKSRTNIPPEDVLEITEFLLTKTWFKFNNNFLSQTDGVAMGGPTSSVIAEIYMQAHESTALTTAACPPKVWERHVDDVFLIIKERSLNDFFEHVNNLHEKITFTIEKEKDACLPFLDTLIKRNHDRSLSIVVYRKPTHTDQYLNFHSNHQMSAKESVVSALFTRADNIISNVEDLRRENERIISVLAANDYNKRTISKVKRNIKQRKELNNADKEVEESIGYINLPYINGTSEILRRIFRQHKIRCTFYSSDTLRNMLSHPKDPVEANKQNNIVYKIPCGDCNAVYIGESKRTLDQRSKEHARAVRNGDIEKNEIADHSWKYNHRFDWEKKTIIDREQNMVSRKIKETIHSINDRNHINSISYSLPDIWIPALTKRKNGNTNN